MKNKISKPVAERGGGGPSGRHLYRGGNFTRKCISTTPIGAPIYIWPRTGIPPAPPLVQTVMNDWSILDGQGYGRPREH